MPDTDAQARTRDRLSIPPGATVLHVEPSPTATTTVRNHLSQASSRLSVHSVASAEDAQSALAEHDVDCIVSAYELPDADGVALLESVRTRHPDLPFVMFTDVGSLEVASDAIAADVSELVLKSPDDAAQQLTDTVHTTLHRTITRRESDLVDRLLQITPVGVAIHDVDGTMVKANDRARELLGLAAEEPLEEALSQYEVYHPDGTRYDREALPPVRAIATGSPVYDETLVLEDADRDERRWVSMSSAPMYDHEGEDVVRTVSTGKDITPLKRRERELEAVNAALTETRNRFDALTNNASVAVVTIDESSTVQFANETVEDVFGYTSDEFVGDSLERVIPDRLEEAHYGAVEDFIETGTRTLDWSWVELPAVTRSGEEIDIGLSFGTTQVNGDRLFTAVIRDITEEKARERELERKREELEAAVVELKRSNDELDQFAHAVSHDLREPLRMVSSYLDLLDRRYREDLDDEADEFIGFALEGIERAQRMVNDLLAYSRLGHASEDTARVDLDDVLETVVRDCSRSHADTSLRVSSEDLPAVVGNRTMLEMLFQNLVSNAIEHAVDDAVAVDVTAETRGGRCVVSVADDGPGIPPGEQDHVFDLFATGGETGGTGVGLALCKKIVHNHGGDIWVESTPGEGTTFAFILPTDT